MQHQLGSVSLKISINSKGAELSSIKNVRGTEYIWPADSTVWARHAPVLFPIVGKLKDNNFIFEEKAHSLPQHGFARDLEFELKEQSNNSCSFELRSSPETHINYPFDFILRTNYTLEDNKVVISHTVSNPSSSPFFFSIGAHPGFNCPLKEGERFEDYYLEFEKEEYQVTVLNDGLRTDARRNLRFHDRRLFLSPTVFDQDALVFENSQINRISLCSSVSGPVLSVDCKNWPWFGIWAKKGSSRFVCLEPWQGVADHENTTGQLSEKAGIIRLEGGEQFNCSYSITIH